MHRALCSLLFVGTVLCPKLALGDPFLLSVQGTLSDGTMSGTLKVFDDGSYAPVSVTVIYDGTTYVFDGAYNEAQFLKQDGTLGLSSVSTDQNQDQLALFFPEPSLVNYSGGALCSSSNPRSASVNSYFAFNGLGVHLRPFDTVTATVVPATTPEPSSWLLTGTGLLGLWAAARRGVRCPSQRLRAALQCCRFISIRAR